MFSLLVLFKKKEEEKIIINNNNIKTAVVDYVDLIIDLLLLLL